MVEGIKWVILVLMILTFIGGAGYILISDNTSLIIHIIWVGVVNFIGWRRGWLDWCLPWHFQRNPADRYKPID